MRPPKARVQHPNIVTVLRDVVALARGQVDVLRAKGGELSSHDALKLSNLVRTLREAWELEIAVEDALGTELGGKTDRELEDMARGAGGEES